MAATPGSTQAKQVRTLVARLLPASLRERGVSYITRSRGVQDRDILGTSMRVEGANHGEADYDDAWLIGLLSEADGFIDLGCNVGFFSLASCVLRPSSRVLAVDANPDCAAATAANLVRNGFGARSQAVSTFVSDQRSEVRFNAVGLGAAGSGIEGLSHSAEEFGVANVVQSDTLDSIVEQTGFVPDLIKVDVEGAEREVLAGAVQTIAASSPRLLVEMHSGGSLTMEANATAVLDWCEANGYAAWYLSEGQRLTDPSQVAHRGRCHLLLMPNGQSIPPIIAGIPQSAPISSVLTRISTAKQ